MFAVKTGIFFQAAIASRYFGFLVLISGTGPPFLSQ